MTSPPPGSAPTAGHGTATWPTLARSALIAAVIVGGAAVVLVAAFTEPWRRSDALTALVLVSIATSYDVVVRRVERLRRMKNQGPYVTMSSVWTFSSALVLPLQWTALLTLAIYLQDEVRGRRNRDARPLYRVAYNIAMVLLSAEVVHALTALDGGIGARANAFSFNAVHPALLIAALIGYLVTNSVLVGLAIALSGGGADVREALGTISENTLEAATLALGGFVAIAVTIDVWFALLAVPAMTLLQRSALIEQLESAATEDGKTGLLNAAAWQHLAERTLLRVASQSKAATVLLVDLDYFKRINDTYGHLAGDEVLRAVADSMRSVLRDRDLLSRFGGEEFIALLPAADEHEAMVVAERLRSRIADMVVTAVGDPPQPVLTSGDPLGAAAPAGVTGSAGTRNGSISVTVSVGVASYPTHGDTLTELVSKADIALYAAKHAGRNRVHVSPS